MVDEGRKTIPPGITYVRKDSGTTGGQYFVVNPSTGAQTKIKTNLLSLIETGEGEKFQPNSVSGQRTFKKEGNDVVEDVSYYTNQSPEPIRLPFVLTCNTWMEEGRYIFCRVNPSAITWNLALRATVEKMRIGEIQHVWKDPIRHTFFDEPKVTISFQAGNIMPIWTSETGEPVMPAGLDNFYSFLSLLDAPKIQENGDTNQVYILYNSKIFPNMTLSGLFSPDGVSWSDNSAEPNTVSDWSATFTVYHSYPKISDYDSLRRTFLAAGFGKIS